MMGNGQAMLRSTVWIAALIAGCAAPVDEPSGDSGHDQLVPPLAGMEAQGQYLLGELLDGLGNEAGYHLSVTTAGTTSDGQAVTVRFDGSASLRSGSHRGADRFFDGVVLPGPEGGQLQLTVVRGGYDVAFYKLGVRLTSAMPWADPCNGGDAVPLAGLWQRTGFHEHAPDRISFACAGSVAYKCTVWGYLAGDDDTSLAWRAHQACTRMARGDYCANGISHTRDGTRIKIYDFAGVTTRPPQHFEGVQAWPPNIDRLFFEAAWNDGARPASCLSRLRWQSLPLGPLCDNGALRDPRQDTGVKFCEDIEWPDPGENPTGALLFNESFYSDLALQVWHNGDDWVSTVRGLYDRPIREPFPGRPGTYVYEHPDGLVVRTLRLGFDPAQAEELHLYTRAGDVVVAGISQPPPGFTDGGFEGYAHKTPFPTSRRLSMYMNPATGDYLSTAVEPPSGYEIQWSIGFVLPPEQPK